MAKQMKRVEKRYVPQQESFRQLPGLRPAAEPVLAAETPVVDPAASKLKEMAEAFGSINKALKDFYTMEKSFEETNRAENRVRSQLGLPPVEGPGFLDYGVAQGYNEGLGIVRGQEAMIELKRRLSEARYGISPEKLGTPDDVRAFVDNETKKIMEEYIPVDADVAYVEGASKFLTQAKLEARVEGTNFWAAQEKQQRFNNFSTFINNHLNTEVLPRMEEDLRLGGVPNSRRFRAELSGLTKIGRDKFGFDRDTAAVVTLENIEDTLRRNMTQALTTNGSFAQVSDLEDMADALLEAMDMPDADGIRLADLKTPEVAKAVESIRGLTENFIGKADAMREKHQQLQAEKVLGGAVDLMFKGKDFLEVQQYVKMAFDKGDIEGLKSLQILSQLQQSFNSGVFNPVDPEEFGDWMKAAAAGRMTNQQVINLAVDRKLSPDVFNQLSSAVSKHRADVSYFQGLEEASYFRNKRALSTSEDEIKAIKEERTNIFATFVKQQGIEGEELQWLKSTYDQAYPYEDSVATVKDAEAILNNGRQSYTSYTKYRQQAFRSVPDTLGAGEETEAERKRRMQVADEEALLKTALEFPALMKSTRYRDALVNKAVEYERRKNQRKTPQQSAPQIGGAPSWTHQNIMIR